MNTISTIDNFCDVCGEWLGGEDAESCPRHPDAMIVSCPGTFAVTEFELDYITTVEVNGNKWVVYADKTYNFAVLDRDWQAPLSYACSDYNDWHQRSYIAWERDLCAKIAAAAGLRGIHAAGFNRWIPATEAQ